LPELRLEKVEKMILPRVGNRDMGWDTTSLRRDVAKMADGVKKAS